MAIVLDSSFELLGPVEGNTGIWPARIVNLKSGKVANSNYIIFYTGTDIKRYARYNKISFVEALRRFQRIGIDDRNGAGVYVPRVSE